MIHSPQRRVKMRCVNYSCMIRKVIKYFCKFLYYLHLCLLCLPALHADSSRPPHPSHTRTPTTARVTYFSRSSGFSDTALSICSSVRLVAAPWFPRCWRPAPLQLVGLPFGSRRELLVYYISRASFTKKHLKSHESLTWLEKVPQMLEKSFL